MSITSRVLSRLMNLPAPATRDVRVERDLRVPTPDGAVLLTDRYVARGGDEQPVVLIRSPYGRTGLLAEMWARPFAERGFQALIQSCRGTFGSSGEFDPHHHERADGLATLEWIKAQAWYRGAIFTFGQSYLGYAQWSIARDAGPELLAMATQITMSNFANMTYAGGSFMLENALGWTRVVSRQQERLAPVRALFEMASGVDPLKHVWRSLPPLSAADALGAGRPVPFFQDWLEHASPEDPWWTPMDFQRSLAEIDKPVCMVAGWYDIFAPWQLQDFALMHAAGRDVQLSVGPWKHLDMPVNALGIREALSWFRAHLTGDRRELRAKPVRLYVLRAEQWRDFDAWPPREAQPARWHLQPNGSLAKPRAPLSAPDQYLYDPAKPTPSLGGPSLSVRPAVVDNRKHEARADVLTYTSEPLAESIDVIGVVSAELWVTSDRVSTDFFVRLCDVSPRGASRNVCDGLVRVHFEQLAAPADGVYCVKVSLWPTAYRFMRGQRLRVQVSSGAHPRWAPNPGTGEPLAQANAGLPQRQSVFHDPSRPSALVLPVVPQN
jgi:uncharacterized protein